MDTKSIILNGSTLSIEDIAAIVENPNLQVRIAPSALAFANKAKKFLDKEARKKIIYGVNTGFGPMASHIIGRNEIDMLQKNLIHGHSMGMGAPLPERYVLAAMVVRLNTLVKGYSGVSRELLKQIQTFINKRIIPVVPEHGAVGTSGDLVQLAHIALAFIGDGEVFYHGRRQPTAKVLNELRIAPYVLKPKEGLSLINGTSMMTGIAALHCTDAQRLISISIRNGAMALESIGAFDDGISSRLHELRPHHGQRVVARTLRSLLSSSRLLKRREKFQKTFKVTGTLHQIPESVQEVYSLRCIPQVVGPVLDILHKVSGEITIEMNAVTDNPVVDWKNKTFIHGGNFHGDYIAAAVDQLKISLVKLTMLSERRANFFLNQKINLFFPPFMNLKKPGLTMGLQGLQFVATSTTSQSQTLAFPQNVHSIPTNGDNQDIVSMGTDAALIAARVIENAYIVFAVELLTLLQTVDFLGEESNYCRSSREMFAEFRKIFPALIDDREAYGELQKVLDALKKGEPLNIEWK